MQRSLLGGVAATLAIALGVVAPAAARVDFSGPATEDLRTVAVWPNIRKGLDGGRTPSRLAAQAARLIDRGFVSKDLGS